MTMADRRFGFFVLCVVGAGMAVVGAFAFLAGGIGVLWGEPWPREVLWLPAGVIVIVLAWRAM